MNKSSSDDDTGPKKLSQKETPIGQPDKGVSRGKDREKGTKS